MKNTWVPAILIATLCGCQPDTPTRQTAAPATQPPAQAVQPSASPVATPAPATTTASADDPLALAKSYGCLVCHAVDKKTIGPAWKDVAAKYRGDKGVEAKLMDKILKGGSGVWGNVPMPPNPKPSEEQRRKMVRFILELK